MPDLSMCMIISLPENPEQQISLIGVWYAVKDFGKIPLFQLEQPLVQIIIIRL